MSSLEYNLCFFFSAYPSEIFNFHQEFIRKQPPFSRNTHTSCKKPPLKKPSFLRHLLSVRSRNNIRRWRSRNIAEGRIMRLTRLQLYIHNVNSPNILNHHIQYIKEIKFLLELPCCSSFSFVKSLKKPTRSTLIYACLDVRT
jgi:hypothetical protein